MTKKKTFSIVVPVYQNEKNLESTIPKLLDLQRVLHDYKLELVFVDDGSSDRSFDILYKYYKDYSGTIILIKFAKNFGQTPAIQAGLRNANGDCVGIISADLQEPHDLFIRLIEHWEQGHRLVIAERSNRDENWFHKTIHNLYWKTVRKIALSDFPIGGFDFCLLDRCVVDDVNKLTERNTSIFPLIFSLGYSHFVLKYVRKKRIAGRSQWTLRKKINIFLDTIIGFSYVPIRAISYLGLLFAMGSFIYSIVIIIKRFFLSNPQSGWASLAVLISFLGGCTLFTLGIIGEYIWRILDDIRQRPNYIIEERFE